MTQREQAAFLAGIEAARQAALIAAVTIETRDDACEVRQQAAAAALRGLAEGLKATFLNPPDEPAIRCITAEFSAPQTPHDTGAISAVTV